MNSPLELQRNAVIDMYTNPFLCSGILSLSFIYYLKIKTVKIYILYGLKSGSLNYFVSFFPISSSITFVIFAKS